MTAPIQRSFSGGEISPSLRPRCDTTKYASGAATIRNTIVKKDGGTQSRAGIEFVMESKDTFQTRSLEFKFNESQTYCVVLGNTWLRVIKAGVMVMRGTPKTVTAITKASPAQVTAVGHGLSTGDEAIFTAIGGMVELNNRGLIITKIDNDNFTIADKFGNNVDSTGYTTFTSGGTVDKPFEIVTPYSSADLAAIKYTQNADVIIMTHGSYPIQQLSRIADNNWTIAPFIARPRGNAWDSIIEFGGPSVARVAHAAFHQYKMTAVFDDTGEESLPLRAASFQISGITNANPAVISVVAGSGPGGTHMYPKTGEIVTVNGITGGMASLNQSATNPGRYKITNVGNDSFSIQVDTTAMGVFAGSATLTMDSFCIEDATPGSSFYYYAVAGCSTYRVYRQDTFPDGPFGYITEAENYGVNLSNSLLALLAGTIDPTIAVAGLPDYTSTPPVIGPHPGGYFSGSGNYPSTCCFINQSLCFANTNNAPETVWKSRVGAINNFTSNQIPSADDAVIFTLAANQVQDIKSILDLSAFLIMTGSGETWAQGDGNGNLTPTSINTKQQSYNGSGDLRPLIIDVDAIYQQNQGNVVRSLLFSFERDGYQGNDLTAFASHLFEGYSLLDWAYQKIPNSIVWAIRSDGKAVALTYIREQSMLAWHHHDTDGYFENVVSIPEGNEYRNYFTIREGSSVTNSLRYIGRMASRFVDTSFGQPNSIENYIGMDSAMTYDGRYVGPSALAWNTLTLTGGTLWDHSETLTLTASSTSGTHIPFHASDVGTVEYRLRDASNNLVRLAVTGYTSGSVVTVRPTGLVPVDLRGIGTKVWEKAVTVLTGLTQHAGKNVSILGDGCVVASPNNPSYPLLTVSAVGTLTLPTPYSVIHIGRPFIADLQTLAIDTAQVETLVNKKAVINKVWLIVEKTRGGFVGTKVPDPSDTDQTDGLFEIKIRQYEDYGENTLLKTGVMEVNCQATYGEGQVIIRQVDPLPISVLAVVPDGTIPLRQVG